jgi:Fibronectin type III domain
MTNHLRAPGIFALGALTLAVGIAAVARSSSDPPAQAAPKSKAAKAIRLEDSTVIIEVNDTEGDAGLQFFLDGEPWRSMKVFGPGGKKVLDLKGTGKLRNWGLTESFHETNEPEFSEVPLNQFKRRFPEGTYRFAGRTIEGRKLVGKGKLSHDIPKGPQITAPAADATVPDGDVDAQWAPVPEPGTEIEGWRVIVERENPFRSYQVELPASQTSVTIPSEFLEPGTEYLIEIQTIEASGNLTFNEHFFRVAG